MGLEPPVLEYARAERVGGDRCRLWFLLAGLSALVGLFVPIGSGGFLADDMRRTLREIIRGKLSGDSLADMVDLAMFTLCLTPLSAIVWRVVRLWSVRPGQLAAIIGLTFGGIHAVGGLGGLIGIVVINGGDGRAAVAAAVGGVVLAVCGGFIWWNRRRLDLGASGLLVLVCVEMALWVLVAVLVLVHGGRSGWGMVFVATGVVRGVECGHVLRSQRLDGERG